MTSWRLEKRLLGIVAITTSFINDKDLNFFELADNGQDARALPTRKMQ